MNAIPRIRIFAGPNGSGKSTFKSLLSADLLGVYLNPDEIQSEIEKSSCLSLAVHGIYSSSEEVREFFERSSLFGLTQSSIYPEYADGFLTFKGIANIEYLAAAAADFMRHKLMEQRRTFTFETVMSHPSKIELLAEARGKGYRTYLYFIATDDPMINISRVHQRVAQGGHSVPDEKIVSRYHRSLELLMPAIWQTDRAYVFDNSVDGQERTWLAEITNGTTLVMKENSVPAWFKRAVLDKIGQ
ncbi:MAG TPA: zeta toxin family protein [Candidatus Kapabacteria bacterium]|nr:zeta toxin family protein [Candidatus Kapabacteria bacterium]